MSSPDDWIAKIAADLQDQARRDGWELEAGRAALIARDLYWGLIADAEWRWHEGES